MLIVLTDQGAPYFVTSQRDAALDVWVTAGGVLWAVPTVEEFMFGARAN